MECSNVYHAAKLKRPLMLVVGEMDDNVDPASTYQLVNALIKAGKDFELVALPGAIPWASAMVSTSGSTSSCATCCTATLRSGMK